MNSKAIAIKALSVYLESKGMDLDDYDDLLNEHYGYGLREWLTQLETSNQLEIIKNLAAVSLLKIDEKIESV